MSLGKFKYIAVACFQQQATYLVDGEKTSLATICSLLATGRFGTAGGPFLAAIGLFFAAG